MGLGSCEIVSTMLEDFSGEVAVYTRARCLMNFALIAELIADTALRCAADTDA